MCSAYLTVERVILFIKWKCYYAILYFRLNMVLHDDDVDRHVAPRNY